MPPRKKADKRNRGSVGLPITAPKTQSDAKATARDAIVAYGAGHGVLSVPVERRITRYLRQERLYAVGGYSATGQVVRECHSLDVEAGAWVAEAPMLESRNSHRLAVLRGELLAVGGYDNDDGVLCSCERLDHLTNAWVRGPDMLTKRCSFGVVVLDGELWAVGGFSMRSRYGMDVLRSCERLNSVTGTWVAGPHLLTTRYGHRVVLFRGDLWAVGGHWGFGPRRATLLTFCERLDTASNRWVPGPAMTVGRAYFGLAVFRGQLWAVGGMGADGKALSSCEYLDVATNTWMAGPPLNVLRYDHGLVVLNGQLWAVGGNDAGGGLVFTCECLNEHVGRTRASNAWVVAGPHSFPLNFGVSGLCVAVIS